MLSGSKESTLKHLTFERATNLAALQLFKCGQEEVDKIIKEDRREQHLGAFIIESIVEMLVNSDEKKELLSVRALNIDGYSAIPFYLKCHFIPARDQVPGQNLIMYRVIPRAEGGA